MAITQPTTTRAARRGVGIAFVVIAMSLSLVARPAAAHPPGVTERISVSSQEQPGNNPSFDPVVNGDGRFVAFTSLADNLVPGDENDVNDVFVRDRQTGTTERVSVSSTGTEGNEDSGTFLTLHEPSISADGRYVAFDSLASNLVPGDDNAIPGLFPSGEDVFVRDRQTGTTERISLRPPRPGEVGDLSDGIDPAISADGRLVAFSSGAVFDPAFDDIDTNFSADIWVHDRVTGTEDLVSVNSQGQVGNNVSEEPVISGDGRFVAFTSSASNLATGDTDNAQDVFVRDRLLGTTEALTVTPNSPPGPDSASAVTSISADGRFVGFWSRQPDLVPEGDNNSFNGDAYVADRQTGTIERVSVSSQGVQGNIDSGGALVSADGRFAAFSSEADNLVASDGNDDTDVFIRDRATGTTVRVSVRSDGTETAFEEGTSLGGISANGQVVAMQSESDDLAPGPDNAIEDIFVHDEQGSGAVQADLAVTITDSPDPVRVGSRLTYTLAVTNNGPAPATATLTDTLPASVRFRSAASTAGSCNRSGQVVTCSLGTLGAGATATVTITVTPRQAGTITNTAQVTTTAADPDPTNNTDTESTRVRAR